MPSEEDAFGHPERGGFLPPVALPRRMFAGARTVYHRPLRAGEAIRREGEVADVQTKTGKSGALVFVLVRYRIFGADGLALEEEHDIVYRNGAAPAKTPSTPEATIAEPDWRRMITPDQIDQIDRLMREYFPLSVDAFAWLDKNFKTGPVDRAEYTDDTIRRLGTAKRAGEVIRVLKRMHARRSSLLAKGGHRKEQPAQEPNQ